jgi:DNA-binding IclR family transcriptional regulator
LALSSDEAHAERVLEILVTHNESVTVFDLSCALGLDEADTWRIARLLREQRQVEIDDQRSLVRAAEQV